MAELSLTPKERQALKARAHALKPVVLLGAAGLTAAVVKEIDRALTAHELVKIRVPRDDRAEREEIWASLADTLSAARVQAIGKLIVLYRPAPESTEDGRPARRDRFDRAELKGNKRQRDEVQQIQRKPAPRRDPSRAHRAVGRRNAPKGGRR